MWKKIFKRECDHWWKDYRFRTVEYIPTSSKPDYNREGAYILSHVYCAECGEVREVVNEGNRIRFRAIPQPDKKG